MIKLINVLKEIIYSINKSGEINKIKAWLL